MRLATNLKLHTRASGIICSVRIGTVFTRKQTNYQCPITKQ